MRPCWEGNRILLVFLIILAGCAVQKERLTKKPIPVAKPPKKAAISAPESGLKEITILQQESLKEAAAEPARPRPELYSLSLKEAGLKEVLLALSRETEYNIIVDPDVSGRVTIDLKKVTIRHALDAILKPLGFEYKIRGRTVRVSKPKPITRLFTLNYVTTSRTGSSELTASTGGAGGGGAGGGQGGGGAAGGGGGGSSSTGTDSVSTTDDFDLWESIEEGIQELLSDDGQAVINRMAGTILVADYPVRINRVADFLEQVEGTLQRQVVIQAEIVEVTLSKGYQMGIDWSEAFHALGFAATITQGLTPPVGPLTTAGLFQVAVTDLPDFSALLSAISSQGQVNVLSRPKITTMNNQKAIIRVAREDVFFETTVTVSTEGVVTQTVSPRTITEGIVLGVTPQISNDGQIIMNIHPSISERAGTAVSRFGDEFPIIDVRETQTVVKVPDGQTLVMAGLMRDHKREDLTGVPCLMDIPFLGAGFRRTEQNFLKTELVIFLTPTILVGKRVDELTAREMERVEKARPGLHLGPWPWKYGTEGEYTIIRGIDKHLK